MSPHNQILTALAIVFFLSFIGSVLGSVRALGVAGGCLIAIGKLGLDTGAGA